MVMRHLKKTSYSLRVAIPEAVVETRYRGVQWTDALKMPSA